MTKLPEPLTEAALKEMLKDKRYWTSWHPEHREYVAVVTEGYKRLCSEEKNDIEQVGGPDTTVQVDTYTQTRDGDTVQVSAQNRAGVNKKSVMKNHVNFELLKGGKVA